MSMFEAENTASIRSDASDNSNSSQRRNRLVDLNAPDFEPRDLMAVCVAAVMMLAPLAAVAIGGGN